MADASDGAARASDAPTTELQQVKARAVKKIRSLEDRLKQTNDELASARAAAATQRQALAAELAQLEANSDESASLLGELAMRQQQELSPTSTLRPAAGQGRADGGERARGERADPRAAGAARGAHHAVVEAQTASTVERRLLQARVDELRRAESELRETAEQDAAKFRQTDAAQRDKIGKLKALLAEARVLIKSGGGGNGASIDAAAAAAGEAAAAAAGGVQLKALSASSGKWSARWPRPSSSSIAFRGVMPPRTLCRPHPRRGRHRHRGSARDI